MQYPVWTYRLRCGVTRLVSGVQISYNLCLIHLGSSTGKSAAKGKCSTGQWILYSLVASDCFYYLWFPIFQSLCTLTTMNDSQDKCFIQNLFLEMGRFFFHFVFLHLFEHVTHEIQTHEAVCQLLWEFFFIEFLWQVN